MSDIESPFYISNLEAQRPIAEMSRQEQAMDWLVSAGSSVDLDDCFATPETQAQIGDLIDEYGGEDRALINEECVAKWKALLGDDEGVRGKNAFITDLMEQVDRGEPITDKLAGLRMEAELNAEPNPYPNQVQAAVNEQFINVWNELLFPEDAERS